MAFVSSEVLAARDICRFRTMDVAEKAGVDLRERSNAAIGERVNRIPHEFIHYAGVQRDDAFYRNRVHGVILVQGNTVVVTTLENGSNVLGLGVGKKYRRGLGCGGGGGGGGGGPFILSWGAAGAAPPPGAGGRGPGTAHG